MGNEATDQPFVPKEHTVLELTHLAVGLFSALATCTNPEATVITLSPDESLKDYCYDAVLQFYKSFKQAVPQS